VAARSVQGEVILISRWFNFYLLVILRLNRVKMLANAGALSALFALLRRKITAHLFVNHLLMRIRRPKNNTFGLVEVQNHGASTGKPLAIEYKS
jgi:hypothetical protein